MCLLLFLLCKIKGPISFRFLNKSVTQAAPQGEAKHKSGFIPTHIKQFKSLFGTMTGKWFIQHQNKADVATVQSDRGNKKEILIVYRPPANQVNQNYANRLTIKRKKGLI